MTTKKYFLSLSQIILITSFLLRYHDRESFFKLSKFVIQARVNRNVGTNLNRIFPDGKYLSTCSNSMTPRTKQRSRRNSIDRRVCDIQNQNQKQRMSSLFGFICILNVLSGLLLETMGFQEDKIEVDNLFSGATPPTTQWTTVFEKSKADRLVKGKLLTTIPALGKQWRVSLEVFPKKLKIQKGFSSVLHMVTGEKGNKFGKSIPAVGVHRSKGLLVSTALGEKLIFTKIFRSNTPVLRKWTQLELSQSLQGEDDIFAIRIGSEELFSAKNPRPRDFYDVKVYAASPSSSPVIGSIRNLKIEVEGIFLKHFQILYRILLL